MKTQGEIEAAICDAISHFEQEYRGRGPKNIYAYLIGDLLVVRLQGLLTSAEQQLAKGKTGKGRDLLKEVRTHLIETAKPLLQVQIQEITGVKVVSLHHDISTVTGEAVVLFTLAESPFYGEAKKKQPCTARRRALGRCIQRHITSRVCANPATERSGRSA